MTRKATEYLLVFSARRLQRLFSDAGLSLSVPPQLAGGLIRFVTGPAVETPRLEYAADLNSEWQPLEKSSEDVAAKGAYL